MRISDWSSDVCSSDLVGDMLLQEIVALRIAEHDDARLADIARRRQAGDPLDPVRHEGIGKVGIGLPDPVDAEAGDVAEAGGGIDRKSTRLNTSHYCAHRLQSSARTKHNTTQHTHILTTNIMRQTTI